MSPALDEELDRLYQLPLAEFVRERNALAAALKKSGDEEGSRRVKDLAKPSASAWAVNQLYWRDRFLVERLLRSGDRYREAQRRALAGEGAERLAVAENERRQAIADAVRRVREILDMDERGASSAVLSRAATTLEALASYGNDNPTPLNGRLTRDLESPGFGALASLGEIAPSAVTAEEREAESERAASRKLEEEEAALAKAVERERRAKTELDLARSRWKEAEERLRRAESESEAAEKSRADREASVGEAKLRVKRRE